MRWTVRRVMSPHCWRFVMCLVPILQGDADFRRLLTETYGALAQNGAGISQPPPFS